jgi:hypothetical protein
VDISPSTETLNFLFVRKVPISLIKLVENSNFDNLYSRPGCHVVSKALQGNSHSVQRERRSGVRSGPIGTMTSKTMLFKATIFSLEKDYMFSFLIFMFFFSLCSIIYSRVLISTIA